MDKNNPYQLLLNIEQSKNQDEDLEGLSELA
jgi:hypothetical protein